VIDLLECPLVLLADLGLLLRREVVLDVEHTIQRCCKQKRKRNVDGGVKPDYSSTQPLSFLIIYHETLISGGDLTSLRSKLYSSIFIRPDTKRLAFPRKDSNNSTKILVYLAPL
jgi:hypothetical protein